MIRTPLRAMLFAALAMVAGQAVVGTEAQARYPADCPPHNRGSDLFYNYYDGANFCGGVTVGMYPAPHPTPPHVGHVYYTYQPLLPHEFMYHHHRLYHSYYDGGQGMNRTLVVWKGSPIKGAIWHTKHFFELPR
jgi:hypothetical protein